MVTVILTSFKEPNTIGRALECILDQAYSGYAGKLELLTVIPDEPTLIAAKRTVSRFKFKNWFNIKDPQKGKPHALNLAFAKAKGDILLLTDGDVYLAKGAIGYLVVAMGTAGIGGVTGRPIAMENKGSLMGYYANLLADAAHHKRMVTMGKDVVGHSLALVSKAPGFFVLSGYVMAIKNLGFKVPEDCLIEDAYVSYYIHNQGYKLAYEPQAKVNVKYANNLSDWFKQKLRSVGGYIQLWKYQVIKPETKVRNFWKELEYFWFPIRYAQNLRELLWSLLLYPLRLILWLKIFYEQRILQKDFAATWVRVESTK